MLSLPNKSIKLVAGTVTAVSPLSEGKFQVDLKNANSIQTFVIDTYNRAFDMIGKNPITAIAILDENDQTIHYALWPKIYYHDKLVDEDGTKIGVIIGKICNNITNKAEKDPATGRFFLRTTITLYNSNQHKKTFYRINFDGNKAVAANGTCLHSVFAIALVKNVGNEVQKNDSYEQVAEGVSIALI